MWVDNKEMDCLDINEPVNFLEKAAKSFGSRLLPLLSSFHHIFSSFLLIQCASRERCFH
jgi:hypothetical protein